jgi:hypothetical protein
MGDSCSRAVHPALTSGHPFPILEPQSGCADIVIGREDGWLEMWDVDEEGAPHKVPGGVRQDGRAAGAKAGGAAATFNATRLAQHCQPATGPQALRPPP